MNVVIELFGERIRGPRKAAHLHSHVQVLPFNVTDRNVIPIRFAEDVVPLGAQTLCGAVPLVPFRLIAVDLDKLRVVNAATKRISHSR